MLKPISDTPPKQKLLGFSKDDCALFAKEHGLQAFRAKQLYDWLYAKAAFDFSAMTNLPLTLREQLGHHCEVGRVAPSAQSSSSDGTKKYLYDADQGRLIEAAYIPEPERATLCVSTQAGCKMGCLFCATGRQGFQGNLDAGAIVNQLLSLPERKTVTNLVYMGMGEPMDNIDAVLKSLSLFTDPDGIGISAHKITVSTIGIIPGMERFIAESQANLAISLHATNDLDRRALMPVQQVYPIADVLSVLKTADWSGTRRLSFEYIMFAGINDHEAKARELVKLVNGLSCRVNLIHYHGVPGNDLQGSSRQTMENFQNFLKEKGIVTTIRRSRGEDIQAACGLLSTRELLKRQPPVPTEISDW